MSSSRLCKQGTQLHPRPCAPAAPAPLSAELAHRHLRPGAGQLQRKAKPRARTGATSIARCHNHHPWPRQAPGLPHLPPEPFAFPLPPPFGPGCHRPQPGPLPGGRPGPQPPRWHRHPRTHPGSVGLRRAGGTGQSRLQRSLAPFRRGRVRLPRRFRPALRGPAAPSPGVVGKAPPGPRSRRRRLMELPAPPGDGAATSQNRRINSVGKEQQDHLVQFTTEHDLVS